MTNQTLVQIRNIQKSYRLGDTQVHALRGLDLSIKRGDFTALVGASGSGKTTLLNLVGCLDSQDSGSIEFDGIDLATLNENKRSHLRNHKIGFIFQSFNLIPVLNVTENVGVPLVIRDDLPQAEKNRRVAQAIKDVGLETFIHHRPDQLSGGQRQRVAIARALVTDPALILADEPTANLDSETANMIIDLLMQLNRTRHVTFFFCSHDEKLISRVDRVVRIKDGRIDG